MNSSRRNFLKNAGLGVVGLGLGTSAAAKGISFQAVKGESERLLIKDPDHPQPAPVGYDRLPLEWYKNTVKRLKDKVAAQGVQVIVFENGSNMTYFTGSFMTTTERPAWVVLPVDADAIFWWTPGLDNDLVKTWWCTEMDYYFDYHHAAGGYPDQGKVVKGNTVDLFQWFMEGLKKKGLGDKILGFDSEFEPSTSKMKKLQNTLPKAKVVNISSVCMKMRMVKTLEEIALTQRAMEYSSKIQAFARDYLLEHGTDCTDFEIGEAARAYGAALIMQDIKRDGRPHNAVGIRPGGSCRTGRGTAYPHGNQFHYNKVKKGDSIQICTGSSIGGYGNSNLCRYYQIAPWDAHREKVWETVAEAVRIQERESKAGVPCCDVAFKVHSYQVSRGKDIQKLLYQRVGHGTGMQSHEPPNIALGDTEILEEGMMFSVEPGLFDPTNDFGYNPCDCLLVTKKKGVFMSSVPWTKEWMFLKL